MTATVLKIEYNVQMGSYKVTKLTLDVKGEEKSYNIFTNAPVHKTIQNELKVGDNIEVTMVKNGKYWNIGEIKKQVSSAPSQRESGGVRSQEPTNKDLAIARAVCIKAAVETFAAMVANGAVKKTIKPDAAAAEILMLCKSFEGYLTLSEDLDALTADSSSISGEGGEFEETPFPN